MVVTGATSGIGKYAALGLAQRGAKLVLTGRDPERMAAAVAWIKARAPDAKIDSDLADFASLGEVRALAARLLARHPRIDVLLNNAGLIMGRRILTADGYETTFQVNHLAPFLLTNLLLPALKATAPSRIVTVASAASRRGHIHFDDLGLAKQGIGFMRAYSQSKLANIMFTRALSRRLAGSGVTANCLHPGFVATNFGSQGGIFWGIAKLFAIPPEVGAENAVYAVAAPELNGVTGQYLVNMKPARPNREADDTDAVERLWRTSADMTGIAE